VDRTWGGCGTGRACVAGDEPIDRRDLEIEVDLLSGRTLRFHVECFIFGVVDDDAAAAGRWAF
jgi:hypothetical protein